MTNNNLFNTFGKHFKENFWLYVITLLCICTGIVLGIYTVKYMGEAEKSELVSYLNSFTESTSKGSVSSRSIFMQTLKNNIPIILGVWFLGLTMIGIPLILIIDIVKGYTIGFTIGFMANTLGAKGAGISLLMVLPQNIIYIPCIIMVSVIAMEFSLSILRDKINRKWTSNVWMKVFSYSTAFIIVTLVMVIGFGIESYISPHVVKMLASNSGVFAFGI